MKKILKTAITLFFLLFFFNPISKSETIFVVTSEVVYMKYKKGWVVNSWNPTSIDGLYIGNDKTPSKIPKIFPAAVIDFYPKSDDKRSGVCRIPYRYLKGMYYYQNNMKIGEGKIFKWDDYLKFDCSKRD